MKIFIYLLVLTFKICPFTKYIIIKYAQTYDKSCNIKYYSPKINIMSDRIKLHKDKLII